MQLSGKIHFKNIVLCALLGNFVSLLPNIETSIAAGGDTIETSTTGDSSISPTPQSAASLTVTPTTLLQNGTNNFANVSSNTGALNYPNCSSCFFGILRTTPNTNNFSGTINNQLEAVIGIIIAIDSPEKANSETNRMIVEIQKSKNEYEIQLALGEKLADAIESGKMERAKIVALLLAPLLGKTHNQLLSEIFAKR
ncbi:hypothetical protein [Pseudanabaena mucicola]|uniref:Uncharacterized protein n=1 Tax=Pseudanabaena mucicola FACHB-723 TaxID=2692860 RepID=A0ABR7ZX97_9CYAN|nr:hypothetical protein [Pseudanabaena mucicola]MBD2188404.1 hypothetical protein [Pseudanabaena mucicola FACHB-723]